MRRPSAETLSQVVVPRGKPAAAMPLSSAEEFVSCRRSCCGYMRLRSRSMRPISRLAASIISSTLRCGGRDTEGEADALSGAKTSGSLERDWTGTGASMRRCAGWLIALLACGTSASCCGNRRTSMGEKSRAGLIPGSGSAARQLQIIRMCREPDTNKAPQTTSRRHPFTGCIPTAATHPKRHWDIPAARGSRYSAPGQGRGCRLPCRDTGAGSSSRSAGWSAC